MVLKIIPIFATSINYHYSYAKIFRFFGFSFFFYSKKHEPIHIHVEGNNGMAKFDWDGEQFVLVEKHNIKAGDMKKINSVIQENADIIISRWNEHFN